MNISKQFYKYVSQNILGSIGVSCYILVDTLFISLAAGANGIIILNLSLPIYSLIYGLGAMVGIGAATRYAILKAQNDKRGERYFSNAIICLALISILFVLAGIFAPEQVLQLMGGDKEIAAQGAGYARIFLMFSPFFMINYVFTSFVRNDNDPTLSMIATLASTMFNIVFDYIFVFPMKLGMAGAALATAVAPIISISICCLHFRKKENTLRFSFVTPSIRELMTSCQLGFSSFVAEMSNGITVMVFNFIILSLVGNIGVAAYGVVANIAIVTNAIYMGISQGSQPLISDCYGKGDKTSVKKLLGLGTITSLIGSAVIYATLFAFTDFWIAIFNSEKSMEMASYASEGIRLYFLGCFFAGFNVFAVSCLSATERAKEAFVCSMSRGLVAIIGFAYMLSYFFGFTGVWLSFLAAEAFTGFVAVYFLVCYIKKQDNHRVKDIKYEVSSGSI